MKFKLDENFAPGVADVFRRRQHDVHTVVDEQLSGASDDNVLNAAVAEGRVLVTLDRDFTSTLRFPISRSAGVVVFQIHYRVSQSLIQRLVEQFLDAVAGQSVTGKLWIVEPGRIRVHRN